MANSFFTSHHTLRQKSLAKDERQKLKEHEKNLKLQAIEKDVLRELLFVFHGIEGRLLRKDGNSFIISPEMITQAPSVMGHARHLVELGNVHSSLCSALDSKTPSQSLCWNALVNSTQSYLRKYKKLVAHLEIQLHCDNLTILHVRGWTMNAMRDMSFLLSLVLRCKKLKGGPLLNELYEIIKYGNPHLQKVAQPIFTQVATIYYGMLNEWMKAGQFYDPGDEFFITKDDNTNFWEPSYYKIRTEMVPKFISLEQARHIMSIGRNIVLLRVFRSEEPPLYEQKGAIHEAIVRPYDNVGLSVWCMNGAMHALIQSKLKRTSEQLVQSGHMILHLQALADFMLLQEPNFTRLLLQHLGPLLEMKICSEAHLKAKLNSVLVAGKQHHDDVMKYLQVALLLIDKGWRDSWDRFSLQYKIDRDHPMALLLTTEAEKCYERLFMDLLRAKRIQKELFDINTTIKHLSKKHKKGTDFTFMKDVCMLVQKMNFCVQQVMYHLQYFKIEQLWIAFQQTLSSISSLEELISAHNSFLDNATKCLLRNKGEVGKYIMILYDLVLQVKHLCGNITEQETKFYTLEDIFQSWCQSFFHCLQTSDDDETKLMEVHFNFNNFAM